MFGSEILEVAVGLLLIYLLLSIVTTSVREGIESLINSRSAQLERGIRELLRHDDDGGVLTRALYEHPMVYGLFRGAYTPAPPGTPLATRVVRRLRGNLPSYIPARSFAAALLDIAAQHSATAQQLPPHTRVSLTTVRDTLDEMEGLPDKVRQALRHAIDIADGDLQRTQKNIEAWYDSAMDRVSGWYRRQSQWIVLAIALVITVGLNVNSITIADHLYRNGDARRALLVEAAKHADSTGKAPNAHTDQAYAELVDLHLPIAQPLTRAEVAAAPTRVVFGLLITTFAIMLGAPFWFDVLNKFMIVRSTVKPHQKSPEASSDDRQKPTADDLAMTVAAVATATTHAMQGVAPPRDFKPPVTTGTSGAPTSVSAQPTP